MTKLSPDLIRDSQHSVIDFMIDNHFCACFSDMGFGKTVAVTTAVEKLFRMNDVDRLLIVTTVRVARDTWPQELQDWAHTSYLKFKLIEGNAERRLAAARGKEQIHIINQENFVWLAEKAGKTWPYDMLVFDDAEGFKNHTRKNAPGSAICTKRKECPIFEHEKSWICEHAPLCVDYVKGTYDDACVMPCEDFKPVRSGLKSCAVLCKDFKSPPSRYTRFGALCALKPQIKRLVHLSGTPTNKGLVDLWALIFTMDSGRRLCRTYTQYKKKYFIKEHNGFKWSLRPGAEVEIHNAVKDICISIPSEAKLPPRHDIDWPITLPPEAAAMYDEFERDLILNLDDDGEIVAANNGVLAGKLLQICGGAVYTGEGEGKNREWIILHDAKFKALDEIMMKHPGEPILIGYNYGHELIRLRKRYPHGVDIRDRRDAVHAWNAGDIPTMFAHPQSAGHGLNLQRGPGRVLIWFGLNWRLDMNKQLNKRLHRPGQARDVYIYYIVAKGRTDTLLMEGVAKYDWTQNQLLEAVKRKAHKNNKRGF